MDNSLENKSNEEDYLNAITKDKKVAKDKKSDDVSKAELKKKEKEEKKKAKKEGKKHRKGLVVAVIILAVLLALALPGAILFEVMIYNAMHSNRPLTADEIFTEQHTESTVVDDECESYECDEEAVERTLRKVREDVKRSANVSAGIYEVTSKSFTHPYIYHKIDGSEIFFPIKKGLGLEYDVYGSSNEEVKQKTDNLGNEIAGTLYEEEFTEYATIDRKYPGGIWKYYNNGRGQVCGFGTMSSYSSTHELFGLVCADEINWKDESNEELAIELAEAYKKETGETIGSVVFDIQRTNSNNAYIVYIRTDANENKQDADGPGTDDLSAQYFYMKYGPDSEWIYAGRTVAVQEGDVFYDCNELSEETKEVFGKYYLCFDQKNGGEFYLDGVRYYLYSPRSD